MFIVVYAYDTARSLFLIAAAQVQATLRLHWMHHSVRGIQRGRGQITSGDNGTSVAGI